jgi:AcrR family transcriptional regulator
MKSRKEEIRDVAAQLFRKRGYQATSMRDIAEAVGIKAASIYNHFQSKQEILEALLMNMATLFTQGMQSINESSLNAENKLEQLIALHIRLTIENSDAIALITGEWVHLEDPVKSDYLALRNSYETEFKDIITTGKSQGLFKDIDTNVILFSLLSTLHWMYSWYGKNKDYNRIELEKQLTDCLLGGIKA